MNASTKSVGRRANPWLLLTILIIIYVLNYGDRYLISGLAETLKTRFSMSDSFLGLLMGPAFAVLYTTLSIPVARIADKWSRIGILVIGCTLWSIFTLLTGLATEKWMLVAMRIGVGLGEACFIAPAYSLLADSFLPERRGRAFALLGLAVYFGQIAGYTAGPTIAASYGWRVAFIIMALPGFAMAAIAWMLIPEPPRFTQPEGLASQQSLLQIATDLWKDPVFSFLNLGMALGTLSGYSFAMWAPTEFVRAYHMPQAQAAKAFGLAFGLAGLVGMLGFGFVSDHLLKYNKKWPLRLGSIALAAATMVIAFVTYAPDLHVAILLAIPSGLLGGGWSIGVMASLQNLLPNHIRATGTALFLTVSTFIGMVFGPFIVGLLSDMFGGTTVFSLRFAMMAAISTGIPGAIALWIAAILFITNPAAPIVPEHLPNKLRREGLNKTAMR